MGKEHGQYHSALTYEEARKNIREHASQTGRDDAARKGPSDGYQYGFSTPTRKGTTPLNASLKQNPEGTGTSGVPSLDPKGLTQVDMDVLFENLKLINEAKKNKGDGTAGESAMESEEFQSALHKMILHSRKPRRASSVNTARGTNNQEIYNAAQQKENEGADKFTKKY